MSCWGDALLGDAKQANVILSVCCGTLFATCVVQKTLRSAQNDRCRRDTSATMAATGRRYIGNLL